MQQRTVGMVIMSPLPALRRELIWRGMPGRELDDLLQETALRTWIAVQAGRVEVVPANMRGIARNLVCNRMRQLSVELLTDSLDDEPAVHDPVLVVEAREALRALAASTSGVERDLVELLVEGTGVACAARALGWRPGTAFSRWRRLKRRGRFSLLGRDARVT